jgi:chromate transporter
VAPFSLRELALYFLRLGAFGFGGPIALAGYMHRDLVEHRRWIAEHEYEEGLALAQLAPGPLAAQLAIYLGWIRHGVTGATVAGVCFIVPSFLMVMALSALYVRFGGLAWMRGAFYGIGAAVIAIIARSAVKLARSTLKKDGVLWTVFAASAAVTAWTESELLVVIVGGGLLTLVARRIRPPPVATLSIAPWAWILTGVDGPAPLRRLWTIAWFFAKAGAVVFGSGLAIVPFLHGGVVNEHHWLTEQQFLDAVAVAMITPGPVVITVSFIGYLIAGALGAIVAAIGVFLPCYLFVVLPAPYFKRLAARKGIRAFVDGVTAGATGAIAGAAIVLGKRALFDVPTVLIGIAAAATIVKTKIAEPLVIIAAGVIGVVLRAAL